MNEVIKTLFTNIPFVISIIINLILGLVGGKILIDERETRSLPPTFLQIIVGFITLKVCPVFPDPMKSAYGGLLAYVITFATFILPFCIKWIADIIWYFKRM